MKAAVASIKPATSTKQGKKKNNSAQQQLDATDLGELHPISSHPSISPTIMVLMASAWSLPAESVHLIWMWLASIPKRKSFPEAIQSWNCILKHQNADALIVYQEIILEAHLQVKMDNLMQPDVFMTKDDVKGKYKCQF